HELGHVLGFASIGAAVKPDDWMTATLPAGVRRLPGGGEPRLPVETNRSAPAIAFQDFERLLAADIAAVFATDYALPANQALAPPSAPLLFDSDRNRDLDAGSVIVRSVDSLAATLLDDRGQIPIGDAD